MTNKDIIDIANLTLSWAYGSFYVPLNEKEENEILRRYWEDESYDSMWETQASKVR